MFNEVFGEVSFETGWRSKTEILLWGEIYEIMVDVEAYFESEGITTEQEASYTNFNNLKSEKQKITESLLLDYYENQLNEDQFRKQLTPTALIISRDGGFALLFRDSEDLDNGLAVVLSPTEEVMSQDEYL